jgi:hypothetical protein
LQLDGEVRRDAKAAAAAAAAGPKQIGDLLRIRLNLFTVRVDEVDRHKAVASQTEWPRQITIAAAEEMPGDSDRRAAPAGECELVRRDRLIKAS